MLVSLSQDEPSQDKTSSWPFPFIRGLTPEDLDGIIENLQKEARQILEKSRENDQEATEAEAREKANNDWLKAHSGHI